MRDTDPEIAERMRRTMARHYPFIPPDALRQEIFLRFYGGDFDLIRKQKIMKHLARTVSGSEPVH